MRGRGGEPRKHNGCRRKRRTKEKREGQQKERGAFANDFGRAQKDRERERERDGVLPW